MRRFIPPSIDSFGPGAEAGEVDQIGVVREAAYHEGYLAGRLAGHAEGFVEAEGQTRDAWMKDVAEWRGKLEEQTLCNTVAQGLAQLLAARSADYLVLTRQTRAAIASALNLLFPTLMKHALSVELLALIEEALTARAAEEIVVRASAETVAAISAQGLPPGAATRVRLRPVPDYPPHKVDIVWSGGGLTFDADALCRKVTDLLLADSMRKDESDERCDYADR
jgi:hypothetical protein